MAYSYDAFGGILSETSGGKTVSHSYGRRGLETGTVLPSGRALSYSYDAAGRTSAIGSAPAGGSPGNLASYSYAGNYLTVATYGDGTSESRSYDAFGRLSALALAKPDASKIRDWNYSYDRAGNPLSDGTDAWAYDPMYRLRDVSYGLSGSGTGLPFPETFAYSANGNRTSRSFGHPDGTSSGSTSYYANRLDQYVSVEKSGTSGTGSDAYSYDLNGNLVETARYRFAYDWANRLVRVTEKARTVLAWSGSERKGIWLGSETGSGSEAPPSDPPPATDPPPADTPPADTGTSSWTENPPADAGSSSWTWVLPADAGSGSAESGSGTGTQSGTTDPGTGSGGTSSGATETWTWTESQSGATDSGTWTDSGNGSSETSSGATGTWSGTELWTGSETGSGTDAGTGETSSGSTESQSGATSSDSTDSGATASGSAESGATVTEIAYSERLVAEYSYDALGRRVSKTLSDRTVSYSYDGQKIVEETVANFSGTVLRVSEFAYGAGGDDDVLTEFRTESGATVVLYFAKDRLGSTVAVTDGSWNVLEEYRYSAFGSPYRKFPDGTWEALGAETETLSGTVRPEPLANRLYTGREWDSETGLYHYRARAYSPESGRFLQRDPVGTADQVSPYAYVRNNPMAWTDPTGMVAKPLIYDGTDVANMIKYNSNFAACKMNYWNKMCSDPMFWRWDVSNILPQIFQSAKESSSKLSPYDFLLEIKNNTWNKKDWTVWKWNLKMWDNLWKYADKSWNIYYNWIKAKTTDLGWMLFGFNIENAWIPNSTGYSLALDVEEGNYHYWDEKGLGYWKFGDERAYWDEYPDRKSNYKSWSDLAVWKWGSNLQTALIWAIVQNNMLRWPAEQEAATEVARIDREAKAAYPNLIPWAR